jgi:hypothetical protein
MKRPRIMIIGEHVTTVQHVSSYCLKQSFEVFPYYGIPQLEEMALFDPHICILCLPICEEFQSQILQPCIFWSQQPIPGKIPWASTSTDLDAHLQSILAV